jgi:hypothetical protein
MNILWIEDFGGNLEANQSLLKLLFGHLLDFKDWDEDEYRLPGRPEDLNRYCTRYSHHRIHLCRHYFDYQDFLVAATAEGGEFSRKIDLVLIDIRLDNGVDFNRPVPVSGQTDQFHKNAGFYIFNDLIRQGFPHNRLYFMTGEASSLQAFEAKLHDLYIPQAVGFEKTDDQYLKLKDKMEANYSEYYRLRRGIIEACQWLRTQFSSLRVKDYKTGDENIPEMDMEYYLASLERLLPIQEPSDAEKHILYRLVVRTLCHEWEGLKPPPRKTFKKREWVWACAWIMKTTRNWITHDAGNIFSTLTAQDVAYFFICNMRVLFDLDKDEIQSYEKVLLELFIRPEDHTLLDASRKIVQDNSIPLLESYLTYFNKAETQQFEFHVMLNELQKNHDVTIKNANDRFFLTSLYQFFWFLSAQSKKTGGKAGINMKQQNQIYIPVYYMIGPFNYYDSSRFAGEFASHIHAHSFPGKPD